MVRRADWDFIAQTFQCGPDDGSLANEAPIEKAYGEAEEAAGNCGLDLGGRTLREEHPKRRVETERKASGNVPAGANFLCER
jgi:hypothetical protein